MLLLPPERKPGAKVYTAQPWRIFGRVALHHRQRGRTATEHHRTGKQTQRNETIRKGTENSMVSRIIRTHSAVGKAKDRISRISEQDAA